MHDLNTDLSDFARAIVYGQEMSSDAQIVSPNYPVALAIAVYRNNYCGNLHSALAGAYPVVEQLVGNDFFRMMTRHFIEKYCSSSGNLHYFGAQMAAFIANFTPAQTVPYLADVAALEWACHCAYFAEDAPPFDFNKLAQIAAERYPDLIFQTHPACHVVRSRYPITAIWHAHQANNFDALDIDFNGDPVIALVRRVDDVIDVCELTEGEARWLLNLQAHTPLGIATADVLAQQPDFDVQSTLINLVSKNVLVDVSLDNDL